VDCCVGGGRYFPYYSYHRNPTGQEFFIPAGTLIAVKLLNTCFYHGGGAMCPSILVIGDFPGRKKMLRL
jgi:hypothetical protein